VSGLDGAQLEQLAGGPVTSLEDAAGAEPVTRADVDAAAKLAAEAEQLAAETEQAAIAGTVPEDRAITSREAARFASLRHALQERRHARHLAAERLRALDQVGKDALALAGRLTALRNDTLSDLAEINELRAKIQARIAAWNTELEEIAARGAELGPEPVLPSGAPPPSSAGVYATTIGGPKIIVRRKIVRWIDAEDPHGDGLPAAIDRAVSETAGASNSDRLILLPGGTVTVLGLDRGGHIEAQIDAGTVHELTPRERQDYLAGRPIDWETVQHD
jgi:hypothetical protein